jgi:formate hydrogenlyase subunit 3/multisubunit Na+/H+ antiporter MnhD subunit
MKYEMLPWLTLFLPIFSAAAITLFTLKHRNASALLSIGAIVIGFVSTVAFIAANGWPSGESAVNWLTIGGLNIDFGLKLDRLSEMMMLIVTGVGGAIHIYSYGYMDHDRSKARFFAFMSLFTFSMLGIVLASFFGNSSACPATCSSASGLKNPARLTRPKKPSSPTASATSDFCSAFWSRGRRSAR